MLDSIIKQIYYAPDGWGGGKPKEFKTLMDEYEPVGSPYDMPTKWEPPTNLGVGGPGEARTIYPGLVERERIDFSGHDHSQVHNNVEYFSMLRKRFNDPIIPDPSIHKKKW